jgi:beta-galactosidase
MHHDLGCLGSAINIRALERQLEILQEMGCNGIRTSHNPPAPELLDLCDRMGFVVMDEAFDMWKMKKTTYDYSLYYDEWHERDLRDFLLRDRNHPSIFIWSIGNEILEQWHESGIEMAQELAGIVRDLDPTRPISSGCNDPEPHNYIIRSGALDIIGYNYKHEKFELFPKKFPDQLFIASETGSAIATRGEYDMPSEVIRRWPVRDSYDGPKPNEDYTCSAYDNCSVPWGSTHEETWAVMKKHDYLSGMFYWTGFDYLGEPTPYWWPARSSYFGIVDLAGFPKDAYWFYQSEWTDKPVLHLFPHWNWQEGDSVDVWVYTNYNEVELSLNGKSLGVKKKGKNDLHLSWRINWLPGTVKAVTKNGDGKIFVREVKTAGEPASLQLSADRMQIHADGCDLSFITIDVLDNKGTHVPHADNLIEFQIEGPGEIAGVDNGNPISHEPFRADYRKVFNGKCLLVVQATEKPGMIIVNATSDGLRSASLKINTK